MLIFWEASKTSGQKTQEIKHWKHWDKNRRKLNIANIQIDAELRQELHEWAEVAVTSVPTLGASRSGHPGQPGQPGHPGQEMFFCDHFHISQTTKLRDIYFSNPQNLAPTK